VVTCARGSSDHAATYAKYLIEAHANVLTSSAAPSLSSVYVTRADLSNVLFLAISQSGKSPDLLAATRKAKASGATTVALCNSRASPLMDLVDHAVPLHAGEETSVAATKSYIASLSCIAQLTAHWSANTELLASLDELPDQLARSWECDWSIAIETLQSAVNLFVIARGFGLGVAQEAALKLKETCALHAEAFSAAEVKHGPMALVRERFPVLMFAQHDDTHCDIERLATEFALRGARVFVAGLTASSARSLPTISAHPVIEPILRIMSFYRMANALALARGLNPDAPPHLNKITETL
jgi:glucosamine--fructose-6-phosphate aminotransferase (isomerizing)